MTRKLKVAATIVIGLVCVLAGGAFTYKTLKTQHEIEPYILSQGYGGKRVLIATQGSAYKDAVMARLGAWFADSDLRIEVRDATRLEGVDDADYSRVVVFSAVQSGRLDPKLDAYLKSRRNLDRFVLFNTADSRTWKCKDIEVDVTTSVSRASNVDESVKKIAGILLSLE